jgi:LysR family transcriptional regulator, regulator of abg operon
MNIDDLIWFSAVARFKSISAAAVSLGISQPTLSKAMARLEDNTKTKLLERQARGVQLTPYGHILRDYAHSVDLTVGDMMAHLRDLRQAKGGTLRWGIGAGVPNELILEACKKLHADGVQLEIAGGMTDLLMQELTQGSLDLLIIGTSGAVEPPAKWQKLMPDPMVPVAPIAHPLAKQSKISMKQLAQANWILPGPKTFTRLDFDASYTKAGLNPPIPIVCSRSSQRDLILSQSLQALITLPRSLANSLRPTDEFKVLPIPAEWLSRRELGFVWRGDGYRNPPSKRCAQIVQAQTTRNSQLR